MAPIMADQHPVPAVVAPVVTLGVTNRTAHVYWSAPLELLKPATSPTFWTGVGLGSLIPPLLDDFELAATAFTWLDGAGTSQLLYDEGVGTSRAFREAHFTVNTSAATVILPDIETSNDGAAWTPLTIESQQAYVNAEDANLTTYVFRFNPGAKRMWRPSRASGTAATAFTEFRFLEYGGEEPGIVAVVIYDMRSGSRGGSRHVPLSEMPTAAHPLNVSDFVAFTPRNGSAGSFYDIEIVAIAERDGREVESRGYRVTSPVAMVEEARMVLSDVNSIAAIGGRIVVGPTTKLAADLTSAATSISVESNVFANGDRVLLQKVTAGVQQLEYLAITSGSSGTGPYTYSVTRNLDGSGADAWTANDPVVGTGQAGSSFIDAYTARGLKSAAEVGPSIVGNVRGSATWNDWTPRWAIGNLNGLYGYGTDTYGAAFGVPSSAWLKIDATNGIRIGHNATTKLSIDASGNATFAGDITAAGGTIGGFSIGSTSIDSGNLKLSTAASGRISIVTSGSVGYGNAGTKFYADGTGKFSLGANLTWDGTDLTVKTGNVIMNADGIELPNSKNISWGHSPTSTGVGIFGNDSTGNLQIKGSINVLIDITDTRIDFGVGLGTPYVKNAWGFTTRSSAPGTGFFDATNGHKVGGTKVIGAQGAAVADATDAASAITQLNALLARVRAHGLIA